MCQKRDELRIRILLMYSVEYARNMQLLDKLVLHCTQNYEMQSKGFCKSHWQCYFVMNSLLPAADVASYIHSTSPLSYRYSLI